MGWYGAGDGPAIYRSVSPAWADANLRELAGHIESLVLHNGELPLPSVVLVVSGGPTSLYYLPREGD